MESSFVTFGRPPGVSLASTRPWTSSSATEPALLRKVVAFHNHGRAVNGDAVLAKQVPEPPDIDVMKAPSAAARQLPERTPHAWKMLNPWWASRTSLVVVGSPEAWTAHRPTRSLTFPALAGGGVLLRAAEVADATGDVDTAVPRLVVVGAASVLTSVLTSVLASTLRATAGAAPPSDRLAHPVRTSASAAVAGRTQPFTAPPP
jgi:hypothetical protein